MNKTFANQALAEKDAVIDRLRGQLQNCVNHLERAANRNYEREKYRPAIEQANKALYDTLSA